MWQMRIVSVMCAVVLDMILGDPVWLYHPIRLVGHLIAGVEKGLRRLPISGKKWEFTAGGVLFFVVVSVVTFIPDLIFGLLYRWCIPIGFAAETFLCYQLLAMKSLKTESMKVYDALKKQDIVGARKAVSMIVGRDTECLDERGITKAAVETVAENTSDGVIAPLFYMTFLGTAGVCLYKAVNTMDSMIGYKNEKYLYFGRLAAKADDVLNFIPARISGIFMIIASYLTGNDGKNAYRIFMRDRKNHASPNSAQTESAVAGALDVQLAGDAYYFGELYHKLTIGDAIREIETEDIKRTNRMLYVAGVLAAIVFCILKYYLDIAKF